MIAFTLQNALRKIQIHPFYQRYIIENLQILAMEAQVALEKQDFDVIYFDPMFSESKNQASVKKDLIILRQIIATCPYQSNKEYSDTEFLEVARQHAKKRVVVKRAKNSAPLAKNFNFQVIGKAHRFDIYLT